MIGKGRKGGLFVYFNCFGNYSRINYGCSYRRRLMDY